MNIVVGHSSGSGNRNNFTYNIPKNSLTNANDLFYSGAYFNENIKYGCQLQIISGQICIAAVYENGVDKTYDYQMIVNYR